jgi:hypothetical protein
VACAQSITISNFTALVDAARPHFVLDINGCSVYVYVVRDFETAKTPLLHTDVPKTSVPASPMDSDEILEAFIKALGPRLTAYATLLKLNCSQADQYFGCWRREDRTLEVEVRNSAELRRAIERALGATLARNYMEAVDAVVKTQRPAAYPVYPVKRLEDAQVFLFFLEGGNRSDFFHVWKLVIEATRWEKAFEILSRIREAAGGRTPPAHVYIVPYWADEEEGRRLVRAAEILERELGTVKKLPNGVEGTIHVLHYGHVEPYFLVFPYPNGTAPPDRATAERVVRMFVQLAGVCRSPMIVEFWPRTGYEWFTGEQDPAFVFAATAAGVSAVVATAVFILRRRLAYMALC